MADLKAFAEQLVNLTVKEVNELAQILKDEYGIEPAAAAVAVAAGPLLLLLLVPPLVQPLRPRRRPPLTLSSRPLVHRSSR